jgi:polyisoprenoid-binding protein YceI
MNRFATAALAAAVFAAPSVAGAATWNIDSAHTTAQFAVRHMMVTKVKGVFDKVSGTVELDEKDPAKSSVDVKIDAATVNTREPKRDGHLKSPDFFDVAKFPNLTFKSTKVTKVGKDHYKVVGDLTIRDVTKQVTLDVEGPTKPVKNMMGGESSGVSATTKINRKDFGLNWNKTLEAGGVLVGEEVEIAIDAELVQKKAEAAPAPAK